MEERRVVVIGTGPAGSCAALFLAKAGIDVTVLEAGEEHAERGVTVRIGGITVARTRRPLQARPALTMIGGTGAVFEDLAPGGLSNHWSCAVPRYSPEDFADAERAGEPYRWPVTYRDLAPWYEAVEPYLSIAGGKVDWPQLPAGAVRHERVLSHGWETMVEPARRLGRAIAPMPYAYGASNTVTLSVNAFNAYTRLLKPEVRKGRVTLKCGARVTRLELARDERRVAAAVYRDARTGQEERVKCAAVVLAAGAINTPQVLLQSTSAEFPDGIGNSNGVVGRYLHDHPVAKIVLDFDEPIGIHPAAYLTRLRMAQSEPLYAAACMQWSGVAYLAPSVLRAHPRRLEHTGFSVFGTMPPAPENRVAVDRNGTPSKDGSSPLTVEIRHPAGAEKPLLEAREHLLEMLEGARRPARVRVWKVEDIGNSNHYAGTCRMHESPRYGVVDGFSRLHDVPNVMVADCSVFTTGPEKNPVLTAMALAARASDRLARDLRTGDFAKKADAPKRSVA
ncbi:MAG TPA: GMC family oxidoreductase [Polyangiaceae bacterium]|nr:GMC family oxidoreductase [Polyangiaceae bacterium]